KARKSPRFDAFAAEYLEWVRANLSAETYRRLSYQTTSLCTFFATKTLGHITAWDIEQYKKARKDAGIMASTINIELAGLKAMLRKAQTWGKLAEHPGATVKPFKEVHKEARFLTQEEESRLLSASSPAVQRIIRIGLLTGFRRQELASLR